MEILLQGTGAADGIPAFFSESRVSTYARAHGGKDIRTRSGALIDGHLKLDFGPDSFAKVLRDRLNAREWSGIVFTHTHEDHLCRAELQYMLHTFTEHLFAPLTIYGNGMVVERLQERFPDWPLEIIETRSFESFDHADYKITPISAYHKLDEDSHNLIVEREGKTFLYGTDTGVWREPTWEFLPGFRFDAVVLECTDGFRKTDYFGHLDVNEFLQVTERLRSIGCIQDNSQVFTTHHCHLGDGTHDELQEFFAPPGVTVGYDGLKILL